MYHNQKENQKDIWKRYQKELEDGYYKEVGGKKCLKAEFIVEYPQELAKCLADWNKNKLSQLWKFYDHARRVQESLRQNHNIWEWGYASLCELQPAVNYAKERNTVTQEFRDFIDYNVKNIGDTDDLEAFVKHFQSVIAYLPRQNQK